MSKYTFSVLVEPVDATGADEAYGMIEEMIHAGDYKINLEEVQ